MNPFSIGVRSRVSAMAVCWSVAIFLGTELCSRSAAAQEGQTSPSREYLQDDIQSFPTSLYGEAMMAATSQQMSPSFRINQLMQTKSVLERHGLKDIARQLEPLIQQLNQEAACQNRLKELAIAAETLRTLDQPQIADQLDEVIKQTEAELEEIRSKGKEQPKTPVSATPAQPKPAAPATDSTVTPVPAASPADKLQAEVQQLQQQIEDLKARVEVLNKKLEEQTVTGKTETDKTVPVSGGGFF